MIIKEYVCAAHGDFDADSPTCPHGCSGEGMVERVFRTPVSIGTRQYANINNTLQNIATEYNLSDMNNFSGEGLRRSDWKTHKRLNEASEAVMRNGNSLNDYFKPISAGAQVATQGQGGTIRKTSSGVEMYGVNLAKPAAKVAGSYDGSGAGFVSGD